MRLKNSFKLFLFYSFMVSIVMPAWSASMLCSNVLKTVDLEKVSGQIVDRLNARVKKTEESKETNVEEFIQAIEQIAARDPVFKKLWNMITQEKFTFAVDQSPNVRSLILKHGFLNLRETGTSGGLNKIDQRDIVEALYLGMPLSNYQALPKEVKPKSMYLFPEVESGISPAFTHYSMNLSTKTRVGDTWIMDYKKIKDKMVFVVGDSLDRAMLTAELSDDPKEFQLERTAKFSKDAGILKYLMPLSMLQSAIPYFYHEVEKNNSLRFVDPESDWYMSRFIEFKEEMGVLMDWQEIRLDNSKPNFDEEFFKKFPELVRFENLLVAPRGNYVEGLYWGQLPAIGNVKAIIFRSQPPSAEEQAALQNAGILIIDGRDQQ